MKITSKKIKKIKSNTYIKENHLFFLLNGINQNTNKWLKTEQELKKVGISSYKTCNKIAIKALKKSIFVKASPITNGVTFFMNLTKNSEVLSKKLLFNNFDSLLLTLLAVKFNNRIYSTLQFKNLNSLKYTENKMLFYQFCLTNLKFHYLISK